MDWKQKIIETAIAEISGEETLERYRERDGENDTHVEMKKVNASQNNKHLFCVMVEDSPEGVPGEEEIIILGDPAKALMAVIVAMKTQDTIKRFMSKAMSMADSLIALKLIDQGRYNEAAKYMASSMGLVKDDELRMRGMEFAKKMQEEDKSCH